MDREKGLGRLHPSKGLMALLGLVIVAGAACSSSPDAPVPALAALESAVQPEVRMVATASVLVSENPDQQVPLIESVTVLPSSIVIDPGEQIDLVAEARSVDGLVLTDVEFVWSMADPRVGSVTRDGRLQAGIRPGSFGDSITVTAIQNTFDGIEYATGFASVTIIGDASLAELTSIAVVPRAPTVVRHQIYRMRGMAFSEFGDRIAGASFVWSLNDARVGRINDLGLLTVEGGPGFYEDAVTLTAIWEGTQITETADVTIVATPKADDFFLVHALPHRFFLDPGDRLQLRAVALNGLGEIVAGTEIRWTMEDGRAGTVDGNGNFIAGFDPGIFTEAVKVEAVVPGESGFARAVDYASVVIRQDDPTGRLETLSVTPGTVKLPPNGRAALLGRAIDERGDPAQEVSFTWEVMDGLAGEIDSNGAFKAGEAPGLYTDAVRVVVEQQLVDETIFRERYIDVVVTGTLTYAQLQPTLVTVAPGRTIHFSLTGWDENQVELPGLVVLWSVTDETIGTIDPFGNFSAGNTPGLYEDAIRAEIVQKLPR